MAYASVSKDADSPCSNVPVQCSLCKEHKPLIWTYNLAAMRIIAPPVRGTVIPYDRVTTGDSHGWLPRHQALEATLDKVIDKPQLQHLIRALTSDVVTAMQNSVVEYICAIVGALRKIPSVESKQVYLEHHRTSLNTLARPGGLPFFGGGKRRGLCFGVVEGCSAPFVDIALLTDYASHANLVT
ncbi:hypothetical protein B0H10DRAFT_1947627 [Mycena sp. CBHHK59/15]|nr:hypothetical protein B0H10DRAFT_1947627 [Mycena sp. CBHHK59/15]